MIKFYKNKKIIAVVFSIISYIALCYQDVLPINNIFSFFIFVIILLHYLKIDWCIKDKTNKDILIISIILSVILIAGRILYTFRYSANDSFFVELLSLKNIVYLIGNATLIFSLLVFLIPRLLTVEFKKSGIFLKKHSFLIPFLIILACWIPYFIIYFPGILTGDSLSELNMILGNKVITDHHTVLHVLFMGLGYQIGNFITHNTNFAVATISLMQMIIMASIFAYFISFINKRNVNKIFIIFSILFFALVPMHAFYSITLWKDVIFSGMCLLLTIELFKLLEKKDNITFKNSYTFIIISLLTVFFRNNAIYMYIILAIFTIFIFKKQLKVILPMLLIVFCVYFVVKGPVYNYFGIRTSKSSEYIAIPLQQIGRMAYKGVEFTKKEEELINELIPVKVLRKSYNAEIVDSIKFNDKYNYEVFDKNKGKYFKLWLSLCYKHFDIAVEAYLTSTLGYWYPNITYWVNTAKIDDNDIGVYSNSFVPDNIKRGVSKLATRDLPLVANTWSIALCFYLIVLFAYIAVRRRGKIFLYIYLPIFGIWLTMMAATPVFAEFRYVYSAFTCLPFLFLSSFTIKTE